jgi:hypothetical protein
MPSNSIQSKGNLGKIMLFSSCCSEIPDVVVFIFFPSSDVNKIACSPAIQTINLVWPYRNINYMRSLPSV